MRAFNLMRDRIVCDAIFDTGEADVGDDATEEGCARLARVPVPPQLSAHRLRRGRRLVEVIDGHAIVLPPCPQYGCHGTVTLRVGRRVVARGRWDCGEEYDGDCLRPPETRPVLRLRPWALRRLRRRSLRATALVVLDPGIRHGALAAPERVLLVSR